MLNWFCFQIVLVNVNHVKLVLEEQILKMMTVLIQAYVKNLNVQRTHIAKMEERAMFLQENVSVLLDMLEVIVHYIKVNHKGIN